MFECVFLSIIVRQSVFVYSFVIFIYIDAANL